MPLRDKIKEGHADLPTYKPVLAPKPTITFKLLAEDHINDSSLIPEPEPVITIKESNFAVRGDIAIVGGLPKTGKTTVCAFMMATALMPEVPESFDSLGIRTSYCKGKPVIYIDTEQPKAYTNKLRKQTLRMIGSPAHPDNLHIINLRKYSSDDKLQAVLVLMDHYPDAHLWIIDGVADLIQDPNDTKQSFAVIETMMMKSDELNTTIVLHIHQNPGGTKLRGNLGSEAERKCGGAIYLSKDRDSQIHAIKPGVIRGTGDFDTIYFKWDQEFKRMVSLGPEESSEIARKTDKSMLKLEMLKKLANAAFQDYDTLTYKALAERIYLFAGDVEGKAISERTAKNRIQEMTVYQYIEKDEKGQYTINKAIL